jgi:hypothetical protein
MRRAWWPRPSLAINRLWSTAPEQADVLFAASYNRIALLLRQLELLIK